MSEQLDQISYRIGELSGEVRSLNSNMEHVIEWMKESNQRVEELKKQVGHLEKFKVKVVAVASVVSFGLTTAFHFFIGNTSPHQ